MIEHTIFRATFERKDPRLGRNVHHDSRSRLYPFPTAGLSIQNVTHARHIPILDQQQTSSCTGNAGIGDLATDPIFATIPPTDKYTLDETGALSLYSDAETIDGDGPYPPNDNGSSGLSIAQALQNAGLISGYQHTFSSDDALKALSVTPILVGIPWLHDMFTPDPDGRCHPTGEVDGGHEIVSRQVDADNERIWLDNSWSANWGQQGRFYLTFEDFDSLLKQGGDVTVLLPKTIPAPTPLPATHGVLDILNHILQILRL